MVGEIPVNVKVTIFGLYGMVVSLVIMYYTLNVLIHFLNRDNVTLVDFFESGRGMHSFKVFGVGILIYAVALVVSGFSGAYGLNLSFGADFSAAGGPSYVAVLSVERVGGMIAFLCAAYFLRNIAKLTDR